MTTPTAQKLAVPAAVDEFVRRIQNGDWDGMEEHLTAEVLYDASVPGWHYKYQGGDRVVREYREEWSGKYRWTIVDRHVVASEDSVVLDIEMHGRPIRDGVAPAVCRLANIFRLDGDRIAEHRYYCCGEWDPETVRHIAEHAPTVVGRTA
jgi:ketosteroid isomerase-like protein